MRSNKVVDKEFFTFEKSEEEEDFDEEIDDLELDETT